MLINCPHCGERPDNEFKVKGSADITRPELDPNATFDNDMLEYIYMRNNPRGHHYEFWHHEGGCRRWLVVERDTEKSHEIYSVSDASVARPDGKFAGRSEA